MLPHLVEMHEKFGKDGLVIITVSLDSPERKQVPLKYLRDKKLAFINLLLNETVDFWQEKLKINGPPAGFVYDREGKLVGRYESEDLDKPYTQDVEKKVKELLHR